MGEKKEERGGLKIDEPHRIRYDDLVTYGDDDGSGRIQHYCQRCSKVIRGYEPLCPHCGAVYDVEVNESTPSWAEVSAARQRLAEETADDT